MPSVRARRRPIESLESRRLLTIELAVDAVSVDSNEDKLVQSLAADAVTGGSAAGTSLVVYSDRDENTGKGEDIYLRRFDVNGVPYAPQTLVNTTFTGSQMNPDISVNDNGAFAIVWQSEAQDGDGWGIYARFWNPSGAITTSELPVNQNTTGDQITPKVAVDASGNFVVTWLDSASGLGDIYARRYSSSGVAVGGAFKVSGASTVAYAAPVVAMQGNGAFAFAWEVRDPSGDNTADVQLRAYDANGNAVGSTTAVNTINTGDQAEPAIDTAGSGYVVAYSDNQGSASSVYHRLYNAAGTATSAATQSNQDGDGDRTRPVVAGDSSGNFLVGWTIQGDGEVYSFGILRPFDKDNVATGNELSDGDGSSARTLFDVSAIGTGRFRDVATLGDTVGYGVATTTSWANALVVAGNNNKNTISVSEINGGSTIRVRNDGTQVDYVRSAYAYLHATLGGESDFFNASTFASSGGVSTLPVSVSGGDGSDTIYGGAAGDSLFGENGTDEIHGGASKDYITGGDDNDLIYGDDGNDNLVGGAGKNTIHGGEGNDRITGSGGHDKFYGEEDTDRLYGGAGNDTMDGGGGTDRLYGQDGNDSLIGGSSNDRMYGDNGDDTLIGGNGTDYLFGGAGTDTRKNAENSDVVDSIEVTA